MGALDFGFYMNLSAVECAPKYFGLLFYVQCASLVNYLKSQVPRPTLRRISSQPGKQTKHNPAFCAFSKTVRLLFCVRLLQTENTKNCIYMSMGCCVFYCSVHSVVLCALRPWAWVECTVCNASCVV